jgi:hypothetical protein
MTKQVRKNTLSLIIIGLGIGWLAGLSVSPVVSIIITSIVGVVITLLSALSGLKILEQSEKSPDAETSSHWQVDPIPIAFLILGIVLGSILGITARTHNWLGIDIHVDVHAEIQKWKAVGIDEKDIVQRLFEREYPLSESSKNVSQADIKQSVLFGQTHNECQRLLSYSPDNLPIQLTISTIDIFNDLPSIIHDPEILEKVVTAQCEKLGK